MNKIKLFSAIFAFGSLVFTLSCSKDTSTQDENGTTSQNSVQTVLRYSIGENAYELTAVDERMPNNELSSSSCYGCGGPGGNGEYNNYDNDWTSYSVGGKSLTIMRQDQTYNPSFRLMLWGSTELETLVLPATISTGRIMLDDLNGQLTQQNDNPDIPQGPVTYEGSGNAITLTITAKKGNVLEGTFSGTLSALQSGVALEVRNGSFQAQLKKY